MPWDLGADKMPGYLLFTPDNETEAFGYIEILGFNGAEVKWGVLQHWRGDVTGIRWSGRVSGIKTARKIVEDMWLWTMWTMHRGTVQPPKEALIRADGKWGKDACTVDQAVNTDWPGV